MAEIEERVRAIEHQAVTLKAYFIAALAVAGIFGLTGAWGFLSLSKVRNELGTAQSQVDALNGEVSGLKGDLAEVERLIDPIEIEAAVKNKINALAKPTIENLSAKEISRAVAVINAKVDGGWTWGGAYDRSGDQCITPNPHTGMCECPVNFEVLDLVDAGVIFCYRRVTL